VAPGFAASKSEPICVKAAVRDDAAKTVSSVVPTPSLALEPPTPEPSSLEPHAAEASGMHSSATIERFNRIFGPHECAEPRVQCLGCQIKLRHCQSILDVRNKGVHRETRERDQLGGTKKAVTIVVESAYSGRLTITLVALTVATASIPGFSPS
jgi:hypothetical protein